MPLNGTSTLGQKPSGREMSRAAFLRQVGAAVRRGDWNALPVLPTVLTLPVHERCQGCAGTGYSRHVVPGRALRVCRECIPAPQGHPGFDVPRKQRPEHASWGVRYREDADGRPIDVWRWCPACDIAPVEYWEDLARLMDALPWQPDCTMCGDLGWVRDEKYPAVAPAAA